MAEIQGMSIHDVIGEQFFPLSNLAIGTTRLIDPRPGYDAAVGANALMSCVELLVEMAEKQIFTILDEVEKRIGDITIHRNCHDEIVDVTLKPNTVHLSMRIRE